LRIRDSSKTRVKPVFDLIDVRYRNGSDWLPQFLRLPIGGHGVHVNPNWSLTIEDKGWGDKEKKLEPPASLLSWLIRHPRMPSDSQLSEDPVKAQKRRDLIEGSDIRLREALSLLRNNPSKIWGQAPVI